jgi:hypothetical protein
VCLLSFVVTASSKNNAGTHGERSAEYHSPLRLSQRRLPLRDCFKRQPVRRVFRREAHPTDGNIVIISATFHSPVLSRHVPEAAPYYAPHICCRLHAPVIFIFSFMSSLYSERKQSIKKELSQEKHIQVRCVRRRTVATAVRGAPPAVSLCVGN